MSSTRQFVMAWAVMGGYLGVNLLAVFAQIVLAEVGIVPYKVSLIPFLLVHLGLIGGLFYAMYRAFTSPAHREAREQGVEATAEVLEVKTTGWRTGRRRTFWSSRPRQYEYRLRVRVTRPEVLPYEATLFEYMTRDQEPKEGATLRVRVHPQRPEVVVLPIQEVPVTS